MGVSENVSDRPAVNECHRCFDDGIRVKLKTNVAGLYCPECMWTR